MLVRLTALIFLTSVTACTTHRGLMLTEVGDGALELYLDESADRTLPLRHVDLRWKSHADGADPEEGTVALTGEIRGGEYVVVWEKPGHTGVPSRENYTNFENQSVRGVAVAEGSFGAVDNARSYAFRIYQKRTVYVFPFFYRIERLDDVVTFGPRPRPEIGGTFSENGDLDEVERSAAVSTLRGQTVWRKLHEVNGVDVPRDADLESDWRQDDESYGKAK